MAKSIKRTENTSEGVMVVSNDKYKGLRHQLESLEEGLGLHLLRSARVFWAGKPDEQEDNWAFAEDNVVYYEVDIKSRDLTEEEKEWCNDTFMHSGESMPDEIYHFTIPKPEKLKKAIRNNNLDRYDNLNTKVPDPTARRELVQSMQENIVRNDYRYNQLSYNGNIHNIDPEWNPNHTDDSKTELRDKASHRSDAYKDSWKEVFGLSYYSMKKARYNAISLYEPHIGSMDPSRKIVELGVINERDKDYCRFCAAVHPEDELLYPAMRGYDDRTIRICEDCAERRREFEDQAVAEALDERAVKNNGQRRLHSNFE